MTVSSFPSCFVVSAPPEEAMMLLRQGGLLAQLSRTAPGEIVKIMFRRDGVAIQIEKSLEKSIAQINPTIPLEIVLLRNLLSD